MVQKLTQKERIFFKNPSEINFESILLEWSFGFDLNDQEEKLINSLRRYVNLELDKKLCALSAFRL